MNNLLITLLLFCTTSAWAVTVSQAQTIYKNIISRNSINYVPQLVITNDLKVYAESSFKYIYLNDAALRSWSANETAFILGHELGHRSAWLGSSHTREYNSDKYGFKYAQVAGYNACQGIQVMRKWKQVTSKSHPAPRDRLNKFRC